MSQFFMYHYACRSNHLFNGLVVHAWFVLWCKCINLVWRGRSATTATGSQNIPR